MLTITRYIKMYVLASLLMLAATVHAQSPMVADSLQKYYDNIEVALMTCEPHDEVYSLYGHTAIRIQDRNRDQDFVVNFGMFDSRVNYFALRFVFGLTDYMMGIQNYDDFLAEYRYYGCAVHMQRVNMTAKEKAQLMMALAENARPENVVYRYNIFYNNCTTRARDILLQSIDGRTTSRTAKSVYEKMSFRDLLHTKTHEHPWAEFGNDILLGVAADYNTTYEEREFLPQVLMKDFAETVIVSQDGAVRPLVDSTAVVLETAPYFVASAPTGIPSPTTCAVILLCVIMALTAFEIIKKKNFVWVEYGIVTLYSVAGLLLVAMWFSEHPTVRINLQILTFNPLYAVLMCPRLRWKRRYAVVMAFLAAFFAGNAIQHYAEGMNIMALSLSIMVMRQYIYDFKANGFHFLTDMFGGMKKKS